MQFFYLILCFSWLLPSYPRYIKPYKSQSLSFSRTYASISELDVTLTFSITEADIPPSVYLLLNFNHLEYFVDKIIGSPTKCSLKKYVETSGAPFNPLLDLFADENSDETNHISSCFANSALPFYFFQLNSTLSQDVIYQLTFQMGAKFTNFADAFSVFLVSNMKLDSNTYIYASNVLYEILIISELPDDYKEISLYSDKKHFTDEIYAKIDQALSLSLLTESQARLAPTDVGVTSFNSMLKSFEILGINALDPTVFPQDITTYPGFQGNLILEIFLDDDIEAFIFWELEVPLAWSVEKAQCVSVDFSKNNKSHQGIATTQCRRTLTDKQIISFYNIFAIPANTSIRINVTNFINPVFPAKDYARFGLFSEKNKKYLLFDQNLGSGFEVQQKNSLFVEFNTSDSVFSNKLSFIANKTQRIMVSIGVPFFDLQGDLMVVLRANESQSFFQGTCVIIKGTALEETSEQRKIQCFLNDSVIVVKNIKKINTGCQFQIFFLSKIKENAQFLSFQIEIYGKSTGNNGSFPETASFLVNKTFAVGTEGLKISEIFYELSDKSRVFDVFQLSSLNNPVLNLNFSFVSLTKSLENSDSLSLIFNNWIDVDSEELLCKLNSQEISCNKAKNSQIFTEISMKSDQISSILLKDQPNLLEIWGLSYKKTSFSSYYWTLEYFLLYKKLDSDPLISLKTANNVPEIATNFKEDQIFLIGQGNSSLIPYTFFRFKHSEVTNLNEFDQKLIKSLKIKVFIQNMDTSIFQDSGFIQLEGDFYVKAQFFKGENTSSSDYWQWDYYEIFNISLDISQEYSETYIKLTEKPIKLVVEYYLILKDFDASVLYSRIFKESSVSPSVSMNISLNLNWTASKINNLGSLIARHSSYFVFDVRIPVEIVENLVVNGSAYFMFLLGWWVLPQKTVQDFSTVECYFKTSEEISVKTKVLMDSLAEQSAIIVEILDLWNFQGDIKENFIDSLICEDLITPTSRNFYGGLGFILDSRGEMAAMKEMDQETNVFSAGNLEIERLLVTPNFVDFISAHYAFYFINQFEIEKNDVIGVYLPPEHYPNVSSVDILCYISYLPESTIIPPSGSAFQFDQYEYEMGFSDKIDPGTKTLIRLNSTECSFQYNPSSPSSVLTIGTQLQISTKIPAKSLLLLEIFGITNPSITSALAIIWVYRMRESEMQPLMESPATFRHVFINETLDYSDNIGIKMDCNLPFHINGMYHYPSSATVSLKELILPNFHIRLLNSQNIFQANQDNNKVKIFADVINEDILIESIEFLSYFELSPDYFIVNSENSKENSTDTTNNSTGRRLQQTSNNEDMSTTSKSNVNLGQNQVKFMTPLVKTFASSPSSVNLTLGRPSVSQRKLVLTYYKYLMPDDEDEICVTLAIYSKNTEILQKKACFEFLRAVMSDISLKILKNDVFVETLRSNLSLELTPHFPINGDLNFMVISFDDPAAIPSEIKTFVNGNLVYYFIYDKSIITFLPKFNENQTILIQVTDFLNTGSWINQTAAVIIANLYDNLSCIIAQREITFEKTQSLGKMNIGIVLIDLLPNSFNTYQEIIGFNLTFLVLNYQFKYNHTIRLMLPMDFPSDYLQNNLTSFLKIADKGEIQLNATLKGTFIDAVIAENPANLTQSNFSLASLYIKGVISSPNYGVSGDFRIVIFNEKLEALGCSFRSADWLANPIITQTLDIIKKCSDLTYKSDISIIGMKKGTIKPIYLMPSDEKGFKNNMNLTFQTAGNPTLKVLNTSLSIKAGDSMAVVYLSVSYDSSEIIGRLHISKQELGNFAKYQDIVPLEIGIAIKEKIKINVPPSIAMYVGGKSFFQEVSLEDLANIPVNITLTPNHPNLQIIGNQNTLIFKENCSKNTFRIQINENANSSQSLNLTVAILPSQFSSLFVLTTTEIVIKLARKPSTISNSTLNYNVTLQISSRTLDFFVSNFPCPVFFYYQICQELESNKSLILSFEEIIKKADENQANSPENIVGVIFCSDIAKNCSGQATGLEISKYYFKGVAVTQWGLQSSKEVLREFEPYPVKPLVISLGSTINIPEVFFNDIICSFCDFFSINPENLYLETNQTCNLTDFTLSNVLSSVYSQASRSYQSTVNYLKEVSQTFSEMDLSLKKLSNLNLSVLQGIVKNFATIDSFIRDPSYFSLTLFLYPPNDQPNKDLTVYASLIDNEAKVAFFRSRYSFLNVQFYLKVYGVLGGLNNVQNIMPLFIGEPFVKTDKETISLTMEVSSEGIVYAIAIPNQTINSNSPTKSIQIAKGLDGLGNRAEASISKKISLDSQGNFRPVELKFKGLKDNVLYDIFYVSGLNVPKELLLSQQFYKVQAKPGLPENYSNSRRVLHVDDEL